MRGAEARFTLSISSGMSGDNFILPGFVSSGHSPAHVDTRLLLADSFILPVSEAVTGGHRQGRSSGFSGGWGQH